MVRSFTPSDDEEERVKIRKKHHRKRSYSRSPQRSSSHSKGKKRKIKTEPISPDQEERERDRKHHKNSRHREERDQRRHEHRKYKRENRSESPRPIKQEPSDDMRSQRRERERNDERRRQARRQRGNNPFQSEDDGYEYGRQTNDQQPTRNEPKEKDKPDFKLSGKLTEDTNTYRGVVIKYNQPPEARKPKKRWRLYPFKGDQALPVLHIHRMSAYLVGRDRLVVDIPTDHPSCSKQHAVLQYRLVNFEREDGTTGRKVAPYIIDLDSSNGTYVNNQRIDPQRYVELFEKDMLKFGFSTREYVLLHDKTDTSELAEEGSGSGSDS